MRKIIFIFLWNIVYAVSASGTVIEIDNIVENLSIDDETGLEDKYEDLIFYSENPININGATSEELENLYFLSDNQIYNIINYRKKYGELANLYELYLIKGLDVATVQQLLHFICVKPFTKKNPFNNAFKYVKHEFINKTSLKNTDFNAGYLGSPVYQHFRYQSYKNNLFSIGISTEKDAGEPFYYAPNKDFMFTSFHLMIKNIYHLKTLVIGDYKVNFGQGLVIRTNSTFGKSSNPMLVYNRDNSVKRHFSSNETNYLRGVAFTCKISKYIELSSFVSHKKIDGTIKYSTDNKPFISSLKTDGLFRTEKDFEKKNTINENIIGYNLLFLNNNFRIGNTFLLYELDKPVIKEKLYQLHDWDGSLSFNVGINYRFICNKFHFFGETAVDKKMNVATINGFSFYPVSLIGFSLLHRYYSPKYTAPYSNSFSDNGNVKNENGIYMGSIIHPIKYCKINTYIDVFKFPWLKYGTDKPSFGYEFFLQATYMPSPNCDMYLRYKAKQKQENTIQEHKTNILENATKRSLRYNVTYQINNYISLSDIIEFNNIHSFDSKRNYGILFCQDIDLTFKKIQIHIRYSYFDAKQYDNRIYCYEKDVLYTFSNPYFYGEGMRLYVNLKWNILNKLHLYGKIAYSHYSRDNKTHKYDNVVEGKILLKYIIN